MVTGQAALSGICSASHERPFAAIPISQHLHIVPVVLPLLFLLFYPSRICATDIASASQIREMLLGGGVYVSRMDGDAPDLTTRIEQIRHDNVHVGA